MNIELTDKSMTLDNGHDIDGLEFEVELVSFEHEKQSHDCPESWDIEYSVLPETIEYCGDDGEQVQAPDIADQIANMFDTEIQDKFISEY